MVLWEGYEGVWSGGCEDGMRQKQEDRQDERYLHERKGMRGAEGAITSGPGQHARCVRQPRFAPFSASDVSVDQMPKRIQINLREFRTWLDHSNKFDHLAHHFLDPLLHCLQVVLALLRDDGLLG